MLWHVWADYTFFHLILDYIFFSDLIKILHLIWVLTFTDIQLFPPFSKILLILNKSNVIFYIYNITSVSSLFELWNEL